VLSRIHSFRNALNPTHRLPPETLSAIFQYAAEYNDGHPPPQIHFMTLTAVTHVCSYWRMTAIGFASLWCTIQVQNMDIARTFLERSKSALLDVYVPAPSLIRLNQRNLWDALLHHIPRFRRFYLTRHSVRDVSGLVHSDRPAPALQHIDIDSMEPEQYNFPSLFSSTPKLSSIHLQGIQPWKSRQYINLKHVSIARLRNPVTAEDFADFLQGNPMLETLELARVKIISKQNRRRVGLPHLRQLNVIGGTPAALLNTLVLGETCNMIIRDIGEFEEGASSIFTLALPEDTTSLLNIHGTLRLALHIGYRDVRVVAAHRSAVIELATVGVFPRAFAEASIGHTGSFSLENLTELWIHGFSAISSSPDWDGFFENMNCLEALFLHSCACDPILDAIRQNEGLLHRLQRISIYTPQSLWYNCAQLLRVVRSERGRPVYFEYIPAETQEVWGRQDHEGLDAIFDLVRPGGHSECSAMSTDFD
jgi:hypothetical protein